DTECLAVIGDRQIRVAALRRSAGHLGDGARTVGEPCVGVQVALEIPNLDQPWQLAASRELDFARAFPQLGRNPRQADRGIDLLLGAPTQARVTREARLAFEEHAVLVDLEPL